MDGAHDMGGMHGFGVIPRERDAAFEADWQRRVFALTEGRWLRSRATDRIVTGRRSSASRPPATLASGYFERWLEATTGLLLEAGLIDPGRALRRACPIRPGPCRRACAPSARTSSSPPPGRERRHRPVPASRRPRPSRSATWCARPSTRRPGHARLPRYVRGRLGTVVHAAGAAVPPDAAADGATDAAPGHVFTVAVRGSRAVGAGRGVTRRSRSRRSVGELP